MGEESWLVTKYAASRSPFGRFFSISAGLVAVLTVVLTGKGVAALQEANWISASPVAFPRIELLGIFPSTKTLLAQALAMAVLVAGFGINAVLGRHATAHSCGA